MLTTDLPPARLAELRRAAEKWQHDSGYITVKTASLSLLALIDQIERQAARIAELEAELQNRPQVEFTGPIEPMPYNLEKS